MGRGKEVTPRKRCSIVSLRKTGMSIRAIACLLHLPKSTVCNIVQRGKVSAYGTRKTRSGRPRVTTPRDDNMIKRLATTNPSISSTEIRCQLPLRCSTQTIRRRLVNQFNLRAHRPAKKPLLTPNQRKKRLQFCKRYSNWTIDDWKEVLFSDESLFSQFGSQVSLVRRPPNTRFCIRYTAPTVKHCKKVMVWGCFSGMGRGSLYFVEEGVTVNADEYLRILDDKLVRIMTLHNCSVFQQDGAPAHSAKKVTQWLARNRVKVLEWPGNSPDLNPIENLWMVMKRKLRAHSPSNRKDIIYWLQRIWCTEISPDYCQKLVESMPKRIRKVIDNRGYTTKY